jgi:hypothetical protein
MHKAVVYLFTPELQPQLTSTFSHPHHQANTMGRRPHGTTASAAASAASAHYNDEDIRRQAYIQSLGM